MEHLEAFCAGARLSPATVRAYRREIARFFAAFPGEREEGVTREQIASFLKRRAEEAFPSTCFRARSALGAYFSYLRAAGVRTDDPTLSLSAPAIPKAHPAPDKAALSRLLAASEPGTSGLRDRAMLRVLCETGFSASETARLCRGDLDRRTGRLAGRPLSPEALDALSAYYDVAALMLEKPDPGDPLFLSRRGARLTRQGVWKIVRLYAARSGVAGVNPRLITHMYLNQDDRCDRKDLP